MSKIEGGKVNFGDSFVVGTNSSRLSEAEIVQAKQVAENIIDEAKNKALVIESQAVTRAEAIVQEAAEKASMSVDDITEEARKNGFDAGYKVGYEKVIDEMQEKVLNLENFTKANFDIKKRIVKSLHTDILDLIIAMARKVCNMELSQNPELMKKLTLAAIGQLKEKENVNIIVNPQMANMIYSVSDELKEQVHTLETIKIIEDPSVSADGTIVESMGSRVDSRLCAQIDKIAQELYNELNSTSEEQMVEEFDAKEAGGSENPDEV